MELLVTIIDLPLYTLIVNQLAELVASFICSECYRDQGTSSNRSGGRLGSARASPLHSQQMVRSNPGGARGDVYTCLIYEKTIIPYFEYISLISESSIREKAYEVQPLQNRAEKMILNKYEYILPNR